MNFADEVYERLGFVVQKPKKLGSGQFGTVYAVDGTDGKKYALKVIQGVENFLEREWEVAQVIKGKSPYLIQLYDRITIDEDIFLKMELANDVALTKILTINHPCAGFKPGTVDLMFQLVSGLNTLHSNNIMHRDIKSDNIMLHKEKQEGKDHYIVKITDYGLSRSLSATLQIAKTVCGSPLHMAPEIMNLKHNPEGVEYNYACDIWSCGLLFYSMSTNGRHPFEAARSMSDLVDLIQKPILRPAALTKVNTAAGYIKEMDALNACWDLIQHMVMFDPKTRLTADKAMRHELFVRWGPPAAQNYINSPSPASFPGPSSLANSGGSTVSFNSPLPNSNSNSRSSIGMPLVTSGGSVVAASASLGGSDGSQGGQRTSRVLKRQLELTDSKGQARCFSDMCPYCARPVKRVLPQPNCLRLDCTKCKVSFSLDTVALKFIESDYQTAELP